ncbi:MAG TPA: TIR domain-containing protein, partial [Pyrinomonadaceae bacterium]
MKKPTKKRKGVFISQTEGKSCAAATALQAWLRDDMKLGDPWLAPEKIPVGAAWRKKLEKALDEACCGILCLTADNLTSHWISYEAGRLRKNGKIFPYVIDSSVSLKNLPAPIDDLQAQRSDREGTEALVVEINKALDRSLRLDDF